MFGLVVAGAAHPAAIRANSTGRAGDVLILTKPLGVGAMTTAIKKGLLDQAGYKQVRGSRGAGGAGLRRCGGAGEWVVECRTQKQSTGGV